MTGKEALEVFGEDLMHVVRDNVLDVFELALTGKMNSAPMQAMHQRLSSLTSDQQDDMRQVIRKFVDCTLHDVLYLLQRDERISVIVRPTDKSGEIDLAKASNMLHAELYSEKGWINRYSQYPSSEDSCL